MAKEKKKYSYIRHPYSINGWYSFGLALAALIMTSAVMVSTVKLRGSVSLFITSMGVSAFAADLMSLVFTYLSFREKDRNYLFALIGGGLAFAVLLAWVIVFAYKG